METTGQRETFRLALSYLERARAELAEWERLRADGKLDRTNYDLVRAKYVAHERDAHRLTKALRRDAEAGLDAAREQLKARRRTQKKLIEVVSAGGVDPRDANDQNRRLTAEIAADSARVEDLEAIVSCESTAALGGPIAFPLDDYPRRLDLIETVARPKRRLSPQEKNIVAAVVMITLVLGAVVTIAILRSKVRARFSVSEGALQTGFLRVQCANEGNRSIFLYAPWPNGRPQAPAGASSPGRSFGLLLSIREAPGREFRAVEGVDRIWKFRGAYVEEGTPIEIEPGITESVFLDLKALREQGLNFEAIAVASSRNGGAEARRDEVQLGP